MRYSKVKRRSPYAQRGVIGECLLSTLHSETIGPHHCLTYATRKPQRSHPSCLDHSVPGPTASQYPLLESHWTSSLSIQARRLTTHLHRVRLAIPATRAIVIEERPEPGAVQEEVRAAPDAAEPCHAAHGVVLTARGEIVTYMPFDSGAGDLGMGYVVPVWWDPEGGPVRRVCIRIDPSTDNVFG